MPLCKCGKHASFGLVEDNIKRWCSNCKEENAVSLGRKLCECGSRPSFGIEGEKYPIWCRKCKKENAVVLIKYSDKKCVTCKIKTPTYNLPGEIGSKWCVTCKPADAINTQKKCCICNEHAPYFNLPGETNGKWCSSCSPQDAINVISKKCPCGITASFGPTSSKKDLKWCYNCKEEGAICTTYKKCSCGSRAIYNLPGKIGGIWCKICKPFEAINIIGNRCACGSLAGYNLPGKKEKIWCRKCKPDGTISVNTRCECGNICHYKLPGTRLRKWCSSCKPENAICDKKIIKCNFIYCDATGIYDGYCLRCYSYLNPDIQISKKYKIKEKYVVDEVLDGIKNLVLKEQITTDKILGGCSKRRPDISIDLGTHWICVENDENSHRGYDTNCEISRVNELYTDMADRPMVLIRFNCDSYTNKNNIKRKSLFKINNNGMLGIVDRRTFNYRINILLNCIIKHIKEIPKEKGLTIEYLFYDEIVQE